MTRTHPATLRDPDIRRLVSAFRNASDELPAAIRPGIEAATIRYVGELERCGLGPKASRRLARSLAILDSISSRRVLELAIKQANHRDMGLLQWISRKPDGDTLIRLAYEQAAIVKSLEELDSAIAAQETDPLRWKHAQERAEEAGFPNIFAQIECKGSRLGEIDAQIACKSQRAKTLVTMWYESAFHVTIDLPSSFNTTRVSPEDTASVPDMHYGAPKR